MKKNSLLMIFSLVSLFAMSVLLTACEEETTMEPPALPVIAPPTSIGAYSADETSVGVVWTDSPDEANTAVLNPAYRINVKDMTGTVLQSLTGIKGDNIKVVTGLTEGTIYTFTISMMVDSTVVTNDSVTVMWSPAKRRDLEGSAPIQVFETSSEDFPSGLDIYSDALDGPQTLSLTGIDNLLIDLFVYTDTTSQDLIIRSAHLSTVILPSGKITFFSSIVDSADALDFGRATPPDASTYDRSAVTIASAAGQTAGRIIYGKTEENNYFRLLIVRDGTTLVWGVSDDRYLTMEISYQSVEGVPYARPVNAERLRKN